jgi:hypothetical protein
MSDAKKSGATHTRVTSFSGGTDQINVAPDVHVKVSHVSTYGATPS